MSVFISKYELVKAKAVIVIYEGDNICYSEIAPVLPDGHIGAMQSLTQADALKLGSTLMNKNISVKIGRIPRNLMYLNYDAGSYEVVWQTNSEVRKLFFKKEMHIPDGYVIVPNLIWCYTKNQLYLFAFKEWKNDDTLLFYAPFHNIHENGTVCLGSGTGFINKETPDIIKFINSVEEGFYKSMFTAIHKQTTQSNTNLLFKKLISPERKDLSKSSNVIPENELVPFTKAKLHHLYDLLFNESIYYQNSTLYNGE